MKQLYKVTGPNGEAYHGGTGKWTPGKWRSVRGELIACERGLHLVTSDHLVQWLGPVIWEAEAEGDIIDAGDKVVARKARVVRRLDTWNERTARLFAADCAERVLPIFEKQYPGDDRPRKAIETVRRFANGEATRKELAAAGAAAGAPAWVAAGAAARAPAWAAAGAAARDAAWAAAGAAARDAAWAAAGDAAWAAARAAAWEWQTARLFDYLEGRA